MPNCYWYSQNKCQLFTMPEDFVYSILARVPQAREDLVTCNVKCPNVDVAFIEFAQNPKTLIEPNDVTNAKHMEHVRKYRDYSKYVGSQPADVNLPNYRPADTEGDGE